ncbi:MAG: ABC transporter permease [Microbacterium sp.]|jgi:ABC-2 type transport system permease protein|nr:ABC transporter permease [Microbacterium sp.]
MTITATQQAPAAAPAIPGSAFRLSLGRVIRSEGIKLVSLRSPWVSAALTIVISLGITTLMAISMRNYLSEMSVAGDGNAMIAQAVTMPLAFTALLVTITGSMLITGEYSTGMIRSTLTAAPDRLRSLFAKAIVLVGYTVLVSVVTSVLGVTLVSALFAGTDIALDFGDLPGAVLPYVYSAVYLVAAALLGLGFGYLLRSGAGAIAVAVGILFILPIVPQVLAMAPGMEWVAEAARYLPSNAGNALVQGSGDEVWQGVLTLAVWVAAVLGLGAIALKTRDA